MEGETAYSEHVVGVYADEFLPLIEEMTSLHLAHPGAEW